MTKDARNSLIAWGSVLAICGLIWLQSRFDVMPQLPPLPRWMEHLFWVLPLVSIVWEVVRSIRAERREKAGG